MIRNFLKTTLRNIARNKAYAIINFIGLTSGLALSLLILVYVRSEVSFDRFHENADRLYRVAYQAPNGLKLASSPPPIMERMTEFFPEVEAAARVYGRSISVKRATSDEAFEETGIFFADSSLMNMMSFEFVRGAAKSALREEFTVVLTEEMAAKYFGDADPLGETLMFAGKHEFKVVGVVKEFPNESHWTFNMLVPYENMYDMESDQTAQLLRTNLAMNYVISHSYTYALLKPGADPAKVDSAFGDFIKKYADPRLQVGQVFTLMPVPDIHLQSEALAEPSPTNTMSNIWIFIGVGLLTVLIACINYINLSTAQSFARIKEIGIRKVLGSQKYQLILQFMAESVVFCLISFALSYVVFYSTLPILNELTGKELEFRNVADGALVVASLVLMVLVAVMAGGYPAYFVTKFDSISGLKGEGPTGIGSQWLRKVLIVFQLGVACMLLSGSLMIFRQLDFLSSRPLGFRKDHIINIPLFSQNLNGLFSRQDSVYRSRLQSFRDQVEGQAGVQQTTLSSNPPGLGVVFRGTIPEGFTQEDNMFVANFSVDYDFFNVYEVDIIAGRGFSRDFPSDPAEAFIVNETAVKEFKWETPENALGKTINREGKLGKIVGVMRDINFTSLQTPVSALVMETNPNAFSSLTVKFDNVHVEETIDKVESLWNNIFPEKTFQFTFLEDQLNQQYSAFRNFGTIIESFTLIAILISCLGVYGLVLFVVQRKVKEIGVRKVLGASVMGILRLIYVDFAILLTIGFVAAVPGSYFLISRWLENFTYHTSISVWTYLVSFLIIVVITAATISYHALKASMANPVDSLRTE
jgi:putative ABC transport system permease protein